MAISYRALFSIALASSLWAQVSPSPVAAFKLIPQTTSAVEVTWRLAEANERFLKAMEPLGVKDSLVDLEALAHLSLADLAPGPVVEAYFPERQDAKQKAKIKAGETAEKEAKTPSRKVLIVPVKNAKALTARLKPKAEGALQRYEWKAGEETQVRYLALRDGFALVAEDKSVLEMALKPGPSIESEMAPLTPWMQEHDLVVMATERSVQQALDELLSEGKKEASAKSGDPAGAPTEALAGLFQELFKKARASVHHAAIAFDLPKDGSPRVIARAFFKAASPLAKEAEALPTLGGHPLGRLSEGPYALAMGGQWPLAMGFFDKLATQYPGLKAQDQAEMAKLLGKVSDQMLRTSFRFRAPQSGEPFFQGVSGVSELKSGKAWMEAMKLQQAWSQEHMGGVYSYQEAVLPDLPSLTVSTDLGKLMGGKVPAAQMAMITGLLFGGNRIQISYAVLDEHSLAYTFGDKEVLKAVVADVRKQKPLSATKGIQDADSLLPKNARFAIYLEPRGFQALVSAVMKSFTGKPSETPLVDETTPLVSSVSMDPTGFQLNASARIESVVAMGKVFAEWSTPSEEKAEGEDGPGNGEDEPLGDGFEEDLED